MSQERIVHCDGPDCAVHERTYRPVGVEPTGWTVTLDFADGQVVERHEFHTWDCLLRWGAAHTEPVEVTPWLAGGAA